MNQISYISVFGKPLNGLAWLVRLHNASIGETKINDYPYTA
jgi:hypothetical protein